MTYPSIDKLQKILAQTVFHYAKDSKKAAGRALGTLIEIITFYILKDWGLEGNTRIEKRLIEYRNSTISHNVEYTLHPIRFIAELNIAFTTPLTSTKIMSILAHSKEDNFDLKRFTKISSTLYSSVNTIKNACVIARSDNSSLVAVIKGIKEKNIKIIVTEQIEKPFAMAECKRVGVEEGNKKGPQTIEKAKQGAYVARIVSSLQKVRNIKGVVYGTLPLTDGKFRFDEYDKLLNEIITTNDKKIYQDFILTIGVVSNHGNWFTSDNPNKELVVLRDAYDWLIFLTDEGIATFIDELLLNPSKEYLQVKRAFLASYGGNGKLMKRYGKNQFTKAQINKEANLLLQKYFRKNRNKIVNWMNILTPVKKSLDDLRFQLSQLNKKDWN